MSATGVDFEAEARSASYELPGRVGAQRVALTGRFEPSPEATLFSGAALFRRSIAMMARFASPSRLAPGCSLTGAGWPKDLLMVFDVPGQTCIEMQTHSYDAFPGRSVGELRHLVQILQKQRGASPSEVELALARWPSGLRFAKCVNRAPISYATTCYHALDTFVLTKAPQAGLHVRFRFEPAVGEHHFVTEALHRLPPRYLQRELHERIGAGPIAFEWTAQVAAETDDPHDPTTPWPERGRVRLGTVILSELCSDFYGRRGCGCLMDSLETVSPAPTQILAAALMQLAGEL